MTGQHPAVPQPPHEDPPASEAIPTSALLLLDAAEEGYLLLDRAWRCSYLNTAAATFLGRHRAELLARPLWTALPELAQTPFAQSCQQAVTGTTGAAFETAFPNDARRLAVSLYPHRDGLAVQLRAADTGAMLRRDLLAEADRALQAANDAAGSAASLVQHLTATFADWVAVAHLDRDGMLVRLAGGANPALPTLLATDGGDPPPIGLSAAHQARMAQGERLAFADLPALFPATAGSATGVIVPLLARGRLIGALAVLRQSATLAHHELDLLDEIGRRVAHTLEAHRLAHEARAALVARDQFLAVAAHELRTPLTALRAHAQLVARRQAAGRLESSWLAEAMAACERAAMRLEQIGADLLAIARLRLDRMPVRRVSLDLAPLVDQLINRLRPQLPPDRRVLIDLPAEPLAALIDPGHLEDILGELLDNAAKFSPSGATIRVWLERDGDGICLNVRDTGIGLPQGDAEAIFEPFNRASNARVRQIRGLGLGLYRCRELLARNGGRIWAESRNEGLGTLVRCWLPRGDASLAAAPA